MFRRLSRVAALVAAILTAGVLPAGENDVLYWMVDNTATVTPSSGGEAMSVGAFFSSHELATEGSAFAARIRVTGGDITEDTFLDLYIPGYGLDVGGGEYGVEFSEVGGYYGAGVPTGNQSPSGNYSAGDPEYSFILELGNIDSSDNWTTVATSAAATYSSIADYIHQTFDMNPSSMAVWTPTEFSAVPEPSCGMLMAVGMALLALRRKRPRRSMTA